MKTAIYYFSASGNSLSLARKLGAQLEPSKIVSIPSVINSAKEIKGDVVGIVCPIYFHNMPHIVREFIMKIKKVNYFFIVYAGAGDLGLCVKRTKKIFDAQKLKLSSLFNVRMPDNSTRYGEVTQEDQEKLFEEADSKIGDIAAAVQGKEERWDENTSGLYHTYVNPGLMCKFVYKDIPKMDGGFTADESCTGCSICQKVCPVGNITIIDSRPVWNRKDACQACLACHNWCPNSAIHHSSTKDDVKRYRNPAITKKDIINASVTMCE